MHLRTATYGLLTRRSSKSGSECFRHDGDDGAVNHVSRMNPLGADSCVIHVPGRLGELHEERCDIKQYVFGGPTTRVKAIRYAARCRHGASGPGAHAAMSEATRWKKPRKLRAGWSGTGVLHLPSNHYVAIMPCNLIIARFERTGFSRLIALLFHRRNYDIPERHPPLFARLKIDGSGQAFVAVQRAACDPRNLFVVDHRYAVLHHRHVAPK